MPGLPPPAAPPACRGEIVTFRNYADADADPIFDPGQRLVVAAVNEDGGLQCFPVDRFGGIGMHGDTVFPTEVLRAFPQTTFTLPFPWSSVEPYAADGVSSLDMATA